MNGIDHENIAKLKMSFEEIALGLFDIERKARFILDVFIYKDWQPSIRENQEDEGDHANS
jgi:hypothetical protein